MNTAFIISEYNPFHKGHRHHLEETLRMGADGIICIMSGNFVQRGQAAIADKFIRAKTAIEGGADLVIELPLKYAVSNATHFASGAVQLIRHSALKGFISCGASVEADKLRELKEHIQDAENQRQICELSENSGLSYPAAQYCFVRDKISKTLADILNEPNNILALEYLKTAEAEAPHIPLFTVKRLNVKHDSMQPKENIASARFIRDCIYSESGSLESVEKYIPPKCCETLLIAAETGQFPVNMRNFETMLLSRLYGMKPENFIETDNVKQGLENRIYKALINAASLDELYSEIKTKRYTHARIRQIILSAALGITAADIERGVSFIRILAFNDRGRELIKEIKKHSDLPVVSNISEIKKHPQAMRDMQLDILSSKLYNLCIPSPEKYNTSFVKHAQYIKSSPPEIF